MAKRPTRIKERTRRASRIKSGLTPLTEAMEDIARIKNEVDDTELQPKTKAQERYINTINSKQLTFGLGPAGTGKTYIAVSLAVEKFLAGDVDKIIITRPVMEAGERLGFLPGELEEKVAPYFAPVRAILEQRLGRGAIDMFVKNQKIVFLPLAYMRGHTLDNAFIILDEAQNTTPTQMKMFLTRLGEHSTTVIDGDLSQRDDISYHGPSGLSDALRKLGDLRRVGVVSFTHADVVRSGLVADILKAYETEVQEEDMEGLHRFLGNDTAVDDQ